MASSVASASEMEKWRHERQMMKQTTVPVKPEEKQNFKGFVPDFDALAKFEDKVQKLAERQEDREQQLEVVPVINVMGSTAGAGSGEFHTYRGYRTKELARLADFEREKKQEAAQKAWEEEKAAAAAEVESKHEKNAKKRDKKKDKKRAAMEAEKEARAAKRQAREATAGSGSGEGGGEEPSAAAEAAPEAAE